MLVDAMGWKMDSFRSDIASLNTEKTKLLRHSVVLRMREHEEQYQVSALPSGIRDSLGGGDGREVPIQGEKANQNRVTY